MDLEIARAHRAVNQYFGVTQHEVGDWANGEVVVEGVAPVYPHLLNAAGGLRSGALLAMVDHVGGLCGGLAALPDGWVVSTNLHLRVATLRHAGPLRLRSDVLRRGRSAVLTRVEVRDEGVPRDDGTAVVVAESVLTSAVLVPESGPPNFVRPASILPDLPVDAPLPAEFLGTREVADGLEIELRDELRNPWGILHGAVVATMVDLAAEHAVRAAVDAPVAVADIVLHFLAPGRVGPVAARTSVIGARADGHVVRVELVDRGSNDRVMSVAIVTVRVLETS